MKKIFPLLVSVIVLLGCHGLAAGERPLAEFRDANFGVRFSYPEALSVEYNPHGGADRVTFQHKGEEIGGLMIRPAPEMKSLEEFIRGGKEHFKDRYGATAVYTPLNTPKGYRFHVLTAQPTINYQKYVVERYVYLREKTPPLRNSPSAEQTALDSISGAFSFEFFCKAQDYAELRPHLLAVINSFRIAPPKTEP